MCVKPFISLHFESMQYMLHDVVVMSNIYHSTLDCIVQCFDHKDLRQVQGLRQVRTTYIVLLQSTVLCKMLDITTDI